MDETGRGKVVSAASLLPMRPEAPAVLGPSEWEDSSSSHSSSDEDNGAKTGDPGDACGAGGNKVGATKASQAQQRHKRQRGAN